MQEPYGNERGQQRLALSLIELPQALCLVNGEAKSRRVKIPGPNAPYENIDACRRVRC
jgi:hypothetical protein